MLMKIDTWSFPDPNMQAKSLKFYLLNFMVWKEFVNLIEPALSINFYSIMTK